MKTKKVVLGSLSLSLCLIGGLFLNNSLSMKGVDSLLESNVDALCQNSSETSGIPNGKSDLSKVTIVSSQGSLSLDINPQVDIAGKWKASLFDFKTNLGKSSYTEFMEVKCVPWAGATCYFEGVVNAFYEGKNYIKGDSWNYIGEPTHKDL